MQSVFHAHIGTFVSVAGCSARCYDVRAPSPLSLAALPPDELFAALYDELHRLAAAQLRRAGSDLSLGATTLLHEAYLNLAGRDRAKFADEAGFLGYAARAMRSMVIDYARRGMAKKRGGGAFEITLTNSLDGNALIQASEVTELEQLSGALDQLAQLEPALAQLVDLHFFCGYSFVEIAAMQGLSDRTVQRQWRKARLLLQHSLENGA